CRPRFAPPLEPQVKTMAVNFACPHCRAVIRSAKPLTAGQRVKCPRCAKAFAVGGGRPQPAQALTPQPPAGDPVGLRDPRHAAPAPMPHREVHTSSVGMLNLSIFVVLLLVGAAAVGGAVYWGNIKPALAVKNTLPETRAESTAAAPLAKIDDTKKVE